MRGFALRALLWKETRQIGRNRSALITATLVPAVMLLLAPILLLIQFQVPGANSLQQLRSMPLPGLSSASGPNDVLLQVIYPVLFVLGGALLPPLTTAYAIVAERERRSLELLVSLPVSVSEVLAAKLIAVLIVTALVGLPYVAIVTALLMVVGIAGPSVIPGLIVPFVAAVVCSISASLLVTLLARDYRSANNLSGAFIVPVLVLSGIVVATFGGVARTLALSGVLLGLAAVLLLVATRWVTFERYLE
jgi:ABC-type Na+ efflux pump permease subunit